MVRQPVHFPRLLLTKGGRGSLYRGMNIARGNRGCLPEHYAPPFPLRSPVPHHVPHSRKFLAFLLHKLPKFGASGPFSFPTAVYTRPSSANFSCTNSRVPNALIPPMFHAIVPQTGKIPPLLLHKLPQSLPSRSELHFGHEFHPFHHPKKILRIYRINCINYPTISFPTTCKGGHFCINSRPVSELPGGPLLGMLWE
jgi:hypothetical protein